MNRKSGPKPLVLLAITLPILQSCIAYNLHVEFDRMTGTAYPVPQTVGGTTFSLESIYDPHWRRVTVDQDTTNIALLTGPFDPTDPNQYDFITDAELDTVETANRAVPVGRVSCGDDCFRYHIYGVVVNHFRESDDGSRSTGTMGRMWTDDTSAFTVFYRNATVQGDAGKYLRSVAHEIGHAHNLHHEDGDNSTTIMNQTRVVGNTYSYEFTTGSVEHMNTHDTACRRPGFATFGEVDPDHPDHGWTTVVCP